MSNGSQPESVTRPRVCLTGDAAARPPGLERALTRTGFQLTEDVGSYALQPPDAVLITLPDSHDDRLPRLLEAAGAEPPRLVVFSAPDPDGPAAALTLGADDALGTPVHLPELCARIHARIRDRQAPRRTPYENEIRETLRDLVAEARTMLQPEEVVVALVRRLSRAFSLTQCSFVITEPGEAEGRILADIETRSGDGGRLDLAASPEIAEAMRTRRPVTVAAGRGGKHGRGPSLVAIPVLRRDAVPAVLLLRRRDSQPALSPAQLEMAASLAQVAAQALDSAMVSSSEGRGGAGTLEGLDRRLQEEFERARRYSLSLSLVLLGVDAAESGTGNGNGAGHDGEDQVRREVGARLRRELRLPDFVVRYGSDEFAIVLPETGPEGAHRSVSRMQERLAALPLESGARPVFSAGIVSYPHPAVTQSDDLFALVEAALMRGRMQSGDRVGRAE